MGTIGVETIEMVPEQPISTIQTGLSFVLVDTPRGIPNEPQAVVSMPQVFDNFGWYKEGKLSHYTMRGAFNNGARTLYVSRLIGSAARSAGGGDAKKIGTSKAQLTHGSGINALNLIAKTGGTGALVYALVIDTAATDNTTASKTGNTITLSLASTSAWKQIPRLCATVLNGQANLVAGSAAASAIVFHAASAGAAGNNLSVEVIDSGGAGPVTYTYNPAGTKLTIDLDGVTETIANVVIAVNALGGAIEAYAAGAGSGNIATFAETSLSGGESTISSLITASYESTGLGTVTTLVKTFLRGTGAVTSGATTFGDPSTLEALTPVASKVIPGNILVVENGPDKGAYLIEEVTSNTGVAPFTVSNIDDASWSGWSATQTNLIYTVYGTSGQYGGINVYTLSPGAAGDNGYVELTLERGGTTIQADVKWLDDDGVVRTLETLTEISPVPSNANFIDSKFSRDARWMNLTASPEVELSSYTSCSTTAGDNTLTKAGATFVSDGVVQGNLAIVTSSGTPADIRVYEVLTTPTSETSVDLSANFTGTQTNVSVTFIGPDTDGAALLALIGSSGMTLNMSGGVDDAPHKDDYEGSEALKIGIYSINKIPEELSPNKFWCPEAPYVVDDTGADATFQLDQAMADFAAVKETLIYLRATEYGLTPTTLATKIDSENFESKFTAMYWPWVRVSDPLSGSWRWCTVVGHMAGLMDRVDAGPEGMHKAPANELLRDVVSLTDKSALEYNCDMTELSNLEPLNVNVIMRLGGYRPYGDFLMTASTADRFIHKRLVEIRTTQSIVRDLLFSAPFMVQSPSTWSRITMKIENYMAQYDRRIFSNGAFENKVDPSSKPWYVICSFENNDLGSTTINIEHGYYVVDTVLKVVYKYGLNTTTGELTIS